MTEEEQVADLGLGRKILKWINKTDLAYVVLGGALGGFLMPLVQKFLKSEAPFKEAVKAPDFYDAWFLRHCWAQYVPGWSFIRCLIQQTTIGGRFSSFRYSPD